MVAASPAAKSSRRMSCVSRTPAPGASTRSSGVPRRMPRNGAPSRSSRAMTAVATGSGRRITNMATRCQMPSPSTTGRRLNTRPFSTRWPRTASIAGSRTTAPNAALRRHGDAGVAERAHERDREHEHRRQSDRHGDGTEQDRPPGRADGTHDGHPGFVAAGQLLPVAGHDEQAVVDRQAESQAPSWR